MHQYTEIKQLPYTPGQLFDLVVDIESYPEFLPWCRAARVLSRQDGSFLGELVIAFHHLSERYTSRITASPPEGNRAGSIEVALVRGPFKHLSNRWRFEPDAQGCVIHLELSFAFKSKLLDRLIGSMFERACETMVGAFTARAESLYGLSQERL